MTKVPVCREQNIVSLEKESMKRTLILKGKVVATFEDEQSYETFKKWWKNVCNSMKAE